MAQVTSPVILDSTGQLIVQALNNLNNNVKPTADQIPMSGSDSTSVKSAIDSLNSKITNLIVYAEYTIANNNTAQDFSYPTGLNSGNCMMEGIKIYTRYNSWVDPLYANGDYFGNLIYVAGDDTSKFRYTPKTAGNGTKIGITFVKIA